jgi:hypothetical protein
MVIANSTSPAAAAAGASHTPLVPADTKNLVELEPKRHLAAAKGRNDNPVTERRIPPKVDPIEGNRLSTLTFSKNR